MGRDPTNKFKQKEQWKLLNNTTIHDHQVSREMVEGEIKNIRLLCLFWPLLLTICGNISALVPTHTMIATHYICLGWSLLHLLHLEVYASSFVLKVFLLRLGAFYFELVNEREREKERKRVMHELAAIMVCVFHGIALYSIVFHGFRLSNLTFRIHVGSSFAFVASLVFLNRVR